MGNLQNLYQKIKSFLEEKFISPFKKNLNNPSFLARSVAVGMFATMLPILMFQQYLCIFLWIVAKKFKPVDFSLIIALAFTVLTNPATMPFVLYGYYSVGVNFTSAQTIEWTPFLDKIKSIIDAQNQTTMEVVRNGFGFVIDEVGLPVLIGCGICVLIITPLSYIITYAIARHMQNKRESANRIF